MTDQRLAGIGTQLSTLRGQAMGLNVFTLFVGFGLGSFAFQSLLSAGFSTALVSFGGIGLVAAGSPVPLFGSERPAAP